MPNHIISLDYGDYTAAALSGRRSVKNEQYPDSFLLPDNELDALYDFYQSLDGTSWKFKGFGTKWNF